MKNTDEIIKLFEVFKIKDKVSSKLKEIAVGEFKQETGLEGEEIGESLNTYIESDVYLNPDKILSYARSIEKIEENEATIASLKSEIEQKKGGLFEGKILSTEEYELEFVRNPKIAKFLGPAFERISGSFEKSSTMLRSADKLEKVFGVFRMALITGPYAIGNILSFNSKEKKEEREAARTRILQLTGTNEYTSETVKNYLSVLEQQHNKSLAITSFGEVEGVISSLVASLKTELSRELLSFDGVVKSAKDKIKQNIKGNMSGGQVEFDGINSTQETLSRIVEKGVETGSGYLDESDIKELQAVIDIKAKELISRNVLGSLKVENGKGKDFLSSLGTTINRHLEMQKIGSLEVGDIRKTIKESLQKILLGTKASPLIKTSIRAFMLSNNI